MSLLRFRRRKVVPHPGGRHHTLPGRGIDHEEGEAAERSITKTRPATRLANRPVDKIRNTDLIEVRDDWQKTKASATVVRRLAFLSHVYTVLRKDWGHDMIANRR